MASQGRNSEFDPVEAVASATEKTSPVHSRFSNDVEKEKDFGTVTVLDPESQTSNSDSDVISHPASKDDVLRHTLHLEDDPSLPAITFRSVFLGIGLSAFGGTISAIYYFKPQSVIVSTVFLAVIAWLLGEALTLSIPRRGAIGRFLNPGPFNKKEHVAIVIMANSASVGAYGMELLATEKLWYNNTVNPGLAIFLLWSSQFLGFGLAGMMRRALVFPKNMLWPSNIPVANMLETLHRPKSETRKQLKVFGMFFTGIFLWEIVPEWIMPILTGFSVFCLARQNDANFTNIFGGASGNEGLGLFSLCFDWQYISGGTSPLYFPVESLISQGIGVIMCVVVFVGVYYGNAWGSGNLPFLSQVLFQAPANGSSTAQWNQTAVIGPDNLIDKEALAQQGLPLLTGTYVINILTSCMMMTAGITHLCLYHWDDVKCVLAIWDPRKLILSLNPKNWRNIFKKSDRKMEDNYDPHYELMLNYEDVPNWWFGLALVLSTTVALICMYLGSSSFPWWGLLVAILVAYIFLLFFGGMSAITGIGFIIQPMCQLLGGYILPGNPVADMWFSLYSYNSVTQGSLLASDMKLAQYAHLAPKITFLAQFSGAAVGALLNFVLMNSIVDNQRAILLSVESSNIWSGQYVQQFNTLSVAFGGLAHELFSVGGKYQWVTLVIPLGFIAPLPFYALHRAFPKVGFNMINTAILLYFTSYLFVGINSSVMMFYIIGFFSQYWLRRHRPTIFVKYNYLVSAALDGGTSVIVFIMSFAIFGAAGKTVNFPLWWGNNANGNYDRCLYTGA